MTAQLLIYNQAIPLSSDAHRDLSVRLGQNYGFAARVNSVPLLAAEFAATSSHLAIVFAGDGPAMMPAALLGLRADENLFVTATGGWDGPYVPAFLRRYPFVFAQDPDDSERLTLCIDEAFEGVNREGRGERLFDADGNRTVFLSQSLQFASDYQAQHQLTQAFCARLAELDLMEEATATATLPDGKVLALSGFKRVSVEKLRALPDTEVLALFRADMLGLVYLHLSSLGAMQQMIGRATSRMAVDVAENAA
jgi:hypothetical protein